MEDRIEPLEAEQARQATDAIKGYIYQIWQSLYKWIHLADEEILYLEGAEDFDVLSPDKSVTTQVKDLSKTLTLRSPEITEAISNFWKLRQREKRNVIFQFLTTAEKGQEQGNPFNGFTGLNYWEQCKNGGNTSHIKKFLLRLKGLPPELTKFIKTSSNAEFLKELIIPIEWNTGEGNLEEVRKQVENDLIVYGEKHKYSASDSKRAAAILYDKVCTILCIKDLRQRCLTKASFIEAFEDALSEKVSKSELILLRKTQSQFTEIIQDLSNFLGMGASGKTVNFQVTNPYIVNKNLFITRGKLVAQVHQKLSKTDFLLIRGSTGMGKSLLSLDAVDHDRDNWRWISFRKLSGIQINEVLHGLYDVVSGDILNYILDDINFDSDYSLYEQSFERFVNLLRNSDKKIIVTSQKKIPSRLGLKLGLSNVNEIIVNNFDTDEVTSLLRLNSCPGTDLNLWVKDIQITTRSHPQLAHARARRLSQEHWDKSKAILRTEELTEVRREVVGNLMSELPSTESRDLLLRLSILTGSFKLKNALILAKYPTLIKTPGVFFNQLIGPYVEQVAEDSYRLSPLLDNAFQSNFSPDEIRTLHAVAGESYLSKTLNPDDFSNILLHGVTSESGRLLTFAFSAFLSIKGPYKKLIYPHIDWITMVHIGTGRLAFPQDEIMNLMFRYIQFSVAVETSNAKFALAVADVWFEEINKFTGKGPLQKLDKHINLFPFMFYLSVFRYNDLAIPISKCVEWLISALGFIEKNPEINTIFKPRWKEENLSWIELTLEVALTKRINSSNIDEFMSAIANQKNGDRLLKLIDDHDTLPKRIVDNVWLDQIDSKTPDWQKALAQLEKIREFTLRNKAVNISAIAVRSIALIKNEYLQDKKGAVKAIADGIKALDKHPELINYEAKIAFIDRDYITALKIWNRVLPDLAKHGDLTAAFAYRDAAVAAAQTNDWVTAAKYFKSASSYTGKQNEKIFRTQCIADYGFALWKLKKYPECLDTFAEVIDLFDQLPDPRQNLRVLGLLKMTSNALIYFQKTVNPEFRNIGIPYTEPFSGSFSQLEFSEKLRALPIPPHISLWTFLAEIEYELGIGNKIYDKLMSVYSRLPVLFQAEAKKLAVLKLLRVGNLTGLLSDLVDFFTLTNISVVTENRHELIKKLTDEDYERAIERHGPAIVNVIAFSTLSFISDNPYEKLPNEEWQLQAKKLGLDECVEWPEYINAIPKMTSTEAHRIIKDRSANVALRVLASVYILTHDDDRDYSLYASALLTASIKDYTLFSGELGKYLSALVSRRWKDIATNLNRIWHDEESKRVLVACADKESRGLKKAAKIALVASDISFLKIDNIKGKLKEIADN